MPDNDADYSSIAKHMYAYDGGYITKDGKSITWDKQLIQDEDSDPI